MKMKSRGFTLVELLVVVTIIAIISGMAIVLVGGATDKAAVTVSMATQKQLSDQVNSYIQLHNGNLPDRLDTLIRSDWSGNGGAFSTLGSTSIAVATDATKFMACPPSALPTSGSSSTTASNINRGVDPESFSGQFRTLTVKKMTSGATNGGTLYDVNALNQIGITTLYDYNIAALSNGRLQAVSRSVPTTVSGGVDVVVIIDPQSTAGQQLYADFGVDLSNTTTYTRKGSATSGLGYDDSLELSDAARQAALQAQIFYVLGVGVSTTMIGDRQLGLQEPPAASIVSQGYYNRYSLVIKAGGVDAGRSVTFVGVLDPKGRGPTAARQAINGIR